MKQNVSTEHGWFARAWFSAHPGCSVSREHVASTQGFDWLLSKPTFLSQMAGWGDVPTGSKNNELNQPKAREPCIMHCTSHKKSVESRALQANSCNNLNKGYCKLGQVKGGCSGRERVNSHAPPNKRYTAHKTLNPWWHRVCKARFQGAASPCSRWPIASFMLYGFTNPVRLHAVYPCILGLTTSSGVDLGNGSHGQHSAKHVGLIFSFTFQLV